MAGLEGAGDGRFAPSPTGELHVGSLRTALIAWLAARSSGSRFLLRIEDLDAGRVRERYVSEQIADLRELGLDWDGEPVRQSERTTLYAEALGQVRERGLVYPCFCSRREIREAASAAHGSSPEAPYPGTCAGLSVAESERRIEAGEPYALRLRASGRTVAIEDQIHGTVAAESDDFVLVRRDGAFAYNLAVVVDDHDQGVDQVVRGDDLLHSTPRQALLYDLMGWSRPRWAHVPLVLGADGSRLAKRHGSVTMADLRAHGIDGPALLGILAASLGLGAPAEVPTAAHLVERFQLATLPRGPWTLPATGIPSP